MLDLNMIHSTARSNDANAQGSKKANETSAKGDADQEFQSEFDATADRNDDVDSAKGNDDSADDALVPSADAVQEVEDVKVVPSNETTELLSEDSEEGIFTDDHGLVEDLPKFVTAEAANSDRTAAKMVDATGKSSTDSKESGAVHVSSGGLSPEETVIPQRETVQRDVLAPRRSENTTAETIVIAKASEVSSTPKLVSAKPDTLAINDGETPVLVATAKKPEMQTLVAPSQTVKPMISTNSEDIRAKRADVNLVRRVEGVIEADLQAPTPKIAAQPADPAQNLIVLRASEEKVSLTLNSSSEIETIGTVETRHTSQTAGTSLAQVLNRSDTPAMIARQMAEVLQRLPDQPVEIALNPKELGRVRMNITAAEAGITVNVVAERPETLDLMRRNIDQLAREFQSMGYEDINFAFSEGEAQQNFADENTEQTDGGSSHVEILPEEESHSQQPLMASSHGVDIRL